MSFRQTVRFHLTALLMGFIGGAAGWFLLDLTVSAQSAEEIEASRIVVGNDIVIANGQITFQKPRRNDSYAALNIDGLSVRNGRGDGAQTATVRAGAVSVVTRYDERPEIFKRVDLEAGLIKYFPDFRPAANSQESETLDMDGLFKRTRAEINALRNRRGRI
jgi:hypothetical protein